MEKPIDKQFIKSLIEEKYFGDLILSLEDSIVKKAFSDDYMFCLEQIDAYFSRIGLDNPVSDFEKDKKDSISKEILRKINECPEDGN